MSFPPPYKFPEHPPPQLKAVQDYIKYLSAFEFDKLESLTTDNFTQQVAPLSLDVPIRTKAQDIAYLRELQASLKGKPLHVSRSQMFHSC